MRFTMEVDGPAVQCTLADWLARGPGIPFLDRVIRVTLEEQTGDSPPAEVPSPIARALRAELVVGDHASAGVSQACLVWAREQPPQPQRTAATRLSLTPPPRRGVPALTVPAQSG
jgi:hypothetical protein